MCICAVVASSTCRLVHRFFMVCDPVVTLTSLHLKTLFNCGVISLGLMVRIKMLNLRLIFVAVFTAVPVVSGWSPALVRAEGTDFGGRKALIIAAGYKGVHTEGGISYFLDNFGFGCLPRNDLGPPTKKLSECLADKSLSLRIFNNLGPCDAAVLIPCIEGVFARKANLDWIPGVYSNEYRSNWLDFEALPEYETGRQLRVIYYMFPGLGSDPNQLYHVTTHMSRRVVRGKLLNPTSLDVSIRPIQKIAGKNAFSYQDEFTSGSEMASKISECDGPNFEYGQCWGYGTNPLDNQFKLVLRLPALPYGWMQGRMFMPDVAFQSVEDATSQPYRVTLTGSPIPTPRITKAYFSDIPAERTQCGLIFDFIALIGKSCFPRDSDVARHTHICSGCFKMFNDVVKADSEFDSATKIVDEWSVSMRFVHPLARGYRSCEKQGTFNGFVSSNAMVFSEDPTFDIALKSLDYVVGGPHFMPDKSVFSGLYSMIITKDYAKCLWGLSKPVYHASLQVTDRDGVASNAVTVVGTDETYVRFSATGFTFSQKTLKVKFFDSAKALAESKKKITCVKGKTVRTIAGVKPVCPKGFKVKK